MMMTADYSCGWLDNPTSGFKPHPPTMPSSPSSQHHKPLRHGIDAILHKTPSFSLSANHSWPQKSTLPHIETLRRRTVTSVSTSSSTWPSSGSEVTSPSCALGLDDSGEWRGDPSSQSSTDSSDDQEDVVVVDDANDTVSPQNDSGEQHSHISVPNNSQIMTPTSNHRDQVPALARETSTRGPRLPPLNEILPLTRSTFKANTDANVDLSQGSFEKVKSAFRPIVRPWLFGNGSAPPCSNDLTIKAPAYRDSFRGVGSLQTKEMGLRSLDAISMLRKKSSVFRVAFNNSRSSLHKGHAMTAMTSPAMDNGQPLPSSLSAWFSWLRSGGLHFGPHAPAQQFSPGVPPPCRGVLSASAVPAPLPTQAPRYNCEACGKSYSTFGGLSKHKQFHCSAQIKKDFRCKFCDKSYSSLGALKMHIRTHTLPCKCTVCGKAFSRPWLLQGHLRTHTGEKPFSCPHCARAFADRSNLRAHLQTHSDVKKYSCRHCSKTFSRMSLLAKHRESSCLGLHS